MNQHTVVKHTALQQTSSIKRDAAVFSGASAAEPRTLLDVLDTTISLCPTAPALDDGAEPLGYRQLDRAVRALAAELNANGIGVGDRVGVRMPSGTAQLYLAILGVLRAGAAYVPVDADDPDERAELIWRESGVCAVFGAHGSLTMRGRPVGVTTVPGPEDDAWIIFTSGSTGTPKGVAVSHRAAAAFVDAEARLFLSQDPIGPGDRVLAGLSVAFDASCEEMWLAWRSGACLVPAPRSLVRAGAELGDWLVDKDISVVSTVPTLAALWPTEGLDRVRLLIFGGEACTPDVVRRYVRADREVWNTYGPTEATVVACAARLSGEGPVRIGLPLDGWELAVVDAVGNPVRVGEAGELVIGGVGLGRYLNADKDARRFAPLPALGWTRAYRSGDLVRAESAGLCFLGRADDQVKIGGRRIELGEVEQAIAELPGVTAAAVTVRKTAGGLDIIVGYVSGEVDLLAAQNLLRDRLPTALVPRLVLLDELPSRTSGKVDRSALPWPLPAQAWTETGDPVLDRVLALCAELLGTPIGPEDDFFASGGNSLAAARLVTALREQHRAVSVADLYRHPTPAALRATLGSDAVDEPPRTVRPTPWWSGWVQAVVTVGLSTLAGTRWVLGLTLLGTVLATLGMDSWFPSASWFVLIPGWLLLFSPLGRVAVVGFGVRALCRRMRPGTYRRGGATHLRLWTAERLVATFGLAAVAGTPLALRYARLLGCTVGRDVELHTAPPVTGLAHFGDGCAVEPEADISGWWLDGDQLHVGALHIGARARIGARCTLLPGARIPEGTELTPGATAPTPAAPVPAPSTPDASTPAASTPDASTPAASTQEVHTPDASTPSAPTPAEPTPPAVTPDTPERGVNRAILSKIELSSTGPGVSGRGWRLVFSLSLALRGLLVLLAAVPPVALALAVWPADASFAGTLPTMLAWSPALTLLGFLGYALLIAAAIRIVGRGVRAGDFPVASRVGWSAWFVHALSDQARRVLFPLYASLFTPLWLRMLGARIGRDVEASTVMALPSLLRVHDGAFLADDVLAAPYELRNGWMRLGPAEIGERAFVGNSGIVGPGRRVHDGALIGVLSDTPQRVPPGSSWLGRPPMRLPRTPEKYDDARTFAPPMRLKFARAAVELCRVIPLLVVGLLSIGMLAALELAFEAGPWLAIAGSGILLLGGGVIAAVVTTGAKWLLVGRFRAGRHPLWSNFVWRNELYDAFVEELAVPWFGQPMLGTPVFTWWMRSLGARIGRGVWCESYWFPEPDLINIGDGASVNRGGVLQTHLFHDRMMRLDTVRVRAGATIGPHSIVLPGSEVGASTTLGAGSLVMAGETVPAGGYWQGNPLARA